MTITAFGGDLVLPNLYSTVVFPPAFGTYSVALSNTTTRLGVVIRVPKTGTLDWFEWRTQTVSNNPDNGIRMSFQDVTSAGFPDNVEDQFCVMAGPFSSNAWQVPSGYMGSTGTGSGTKRSVTKGEYIACVLQLENFVTGDNLQASIFNTDGSRFGTPGNYQIACTSGDSGASYTGQADNPVVALRYDDGTYGFCQSGIIPATTVNTRTFNSGSTPDERGLLFQVPVPARLKGFYLIYDGNNAACDFVLYNSANTVLETLAAQLFTGQNAAGGYTYFEFASPHDLNANSNYRLTVLPGGSNVAIYDFDVNSSALRAAIDGGATWMSTQRTDGGAWTDTNTNRPFIHLVFDGFDNAAGGGGGEHSAVF